MYNAFNIELQTKLFYILYQELQQKYILGTSEFFIIILLYPQWEITPIFLCGYLDRKGIEISPRGMDSGFNPSKF